MLPLFRTLRAWNLAPPKAEPAELARWSTDLSSKLATFEDRIVEWVGAVRSVVVERPTVDSSVLRVAGYECHVDEVVLIDATAALTLNAPESTAENVGRYITFLRIAGAGIITIRPVVGLVDGAATIAMAAGVTSLRIMSTGAAYGWRSIG